VAWLQLSACPQSLMASLAEEVERHADEAMQQHSLLQESLVCLSL